MIRASGFAAVAVAALAGAAGARTGSSTAVFAPPAPTAVLTDANGRGGVDSYVWGDARGRMTLRTFAGRTLWRTRAARVAAEPRVVAAGDFTGDRVPDYVFWVLRADSDGRTGRTRGPAPALGDICWNTRQFNYPTHQWEYSTVYVGDLTRSRGNEVVTVPYYATTGTVWNFAAKRRWRRVGTFAYPSTPAFDAAYARANHTPCSQPLGGGRCFFPYSHVANAVILPRRAGLLTLTSMRAVVYRSNLAPTSDVTWIPGGRRDTLGRNYGLLERYRSHGRSYADLVGGCSVIDTRRRMRGEAWDRHCGIVRHLERFALDGPRVRRVGGVYYGFSHDEGFYEGRVEFPRNAHVRLTRRGGTAAVFNVHRRGTWEVTMVSRGAATTERRFRGWFLWDAADLDGDGDSELLATRAAGFVPPRSFDVLSFDRGRLVSRAHCAGVVPALLPFASTPAKHVSDGSIWGAYTRHRAILAEDARGKLRWVRWRRGA